MNLVDRVFSTSGISFFIFCLSLAFCSRSCFRSWSTSCFVSVSSLVCGTNRAGFSPIIITGGEGGEEGKEEGEEEEEEEEEEEGDSSSSSSSITMTSLLLKGFLSVLGLGFFVPLASRKKFKSCSREQALSSCLTQYSLG